MRSARALLLLLVVVVVVCAAAQLAIIELEQLAPRLIGLGISLEAAGVTRGPGWVPPKPHFSDAPFPTPPPAISNPAPDFRRPCLDKLVSPDFRRPDLGQLPII